MSTTYTSRSGVEKRGGPRHIAAYRFLDRMFDTTDLFELRALGIGPFPIKDKPGQSYTAKVAGHVTLASPGLFSNLSDAVAYAMAGWPEFHPAKDEYGRISVDSYEMAWESAACWNLNATNPGEWGRPTGVYFSLNPLAPDRFTDRNSFGGWYPANERRKVSRGIPHAGDNDVPARRWVVIDVDPHRPNDVMATDAERQAAADLSGEVAEWLAARGWPTPVVVDSGSGRHSYWRFTAGDELPGGWVFDKTADPLARFLSAMQKQFAGRPAAVDAKVYNAGRIMRLPGFDNRKGPDTPDRPHRPCVVVSDLTAPDVRLSRATLDTTLTELSGHLPPPCRSRPVAGARRWPAATPRKPRRPVPCGRPSGMPPARMCRRPFRSRTGAAS